MSTLRALTMPKWGIEMSEGVVADWFMREGEAVAKGTTIAAIETEKIVNDVEAEFDTHCLRIVADVGEAYPVGALLAVFGEAGTSAGDVDAFIAGFVPAGDAADVVDEPPAQTVASTPSVAASPAAAATSIPADMAVSVGARALLAEVSVDLGAIDGSGRHGRVLKQDVEQALKSPRAVGGVAAIDNRIGPTVARLAATPIAQRLAAARGIELTGIVGSGTYGRVRARDLPDEIVDIGEDGPQRRPFSRMRKQIARRLAASYREIPHYYLETHVNVDALLVARERRNQSGAIRVSLNDYLIAAVGRTLVKHPDLNVHVDDETIVAFDDVNVAMAVAIDEGLVTPVIKQADRLTLEQIAAESRRLADGARRGNLPFADFSGGTFTVSNLGMFGVSRFTAIINPPQAAILSVGAVRRVPRETADGIVFGNELTVTLGCDHRVIDGAVGGAMLATLKALLEDPARLAGA
ncbi:MAG: dihydrolipoamide acetyltransferase family protein [Pseudomonadota bacterium]